MAAIFAASMHIAETKTHMDNKVIHVQSETKKEAKAARVVMVLCAFSK